MPRLGCASGGGVQELSELCDEVQRRREVLFARLQHLQQHVQAQQGVASGTRTDDVDVEMMEARASVSELVREVSALCQAYDSIEFDEL